MPPRADADGGGRRHGSSRCDAQCLRVSGGGESSTGVCFAKAAGQLAKSVSIDALVLVHCADAIRPSVRALADEQARDLELHYIFPKIYSFLV